METAPLPAADAAADEEGGLIAGGRPRLRTLWYCAALACLASVLMFWELGADALTGDEAQYALVVQNIKRSGSWLYVTPYPPTPYLQKPPLYFWLTASTYDLLGRAEFAYRAWSAAAGVGAVVLTCVLGALLLTPELGGLAGLLLMTNRSFLLTHGARSGSFDALVTFLVVASAVAYWMTVRGKLRWTGWIGVGVFAGLASLAKPGVGVPVLALLALHAVAVAGTLPRAVRFAGPVVGLLALLAVASPWYVAQWQKYDNFAEQMVARNLVERVTRGVDDRHLRDWDFYLQQVSKSSVPFLLVIPAMIYCLTAWVRGQRRAEHGLLALVGIGWVLLFSFSASKAVHYAYPAFPFLAVMLADGAARLAQVLRRGRRPHAVWAIAAVLVVAFTFQYARTLYHAIPAERAPYVPWEMYKVLSPAIRSGEARVVFCGFPELQTDWRNGLHLRARDCYYLEQLRPQAVWVADPKDLPPLLTQRKPTLLLIAKPGGILAAPVDAELRGRTDDRFIYPHQGYIAMGIDLNPVMAPALRPGESNPYLTLDGEPAPGTFRFSVTPPVVSAARVGARLRLPPGTPNDPVRFSFALTGGGGGRKRLEDHTVSPAGGVVDVSAMVEADLWSGPSRHELTLTLTPQGPSAGEQFAPVLEELRLTMLPHPSPELHPRR